MNKISTENEPLSVKHRKPHPRYKQIIHTYKHDINTLSTPIHTHYTIKLTQFNITGNETTVEKIYISFFR